MPTLNIWKAIYMCQKILFTILPPYSSINEEAGEVIAKGLSTEPDNFLLQRFNMYNAFETKDYDNGIQQADRFLNTPNSKFIWQDYLYQGRLLELADNHNEIYKDIANVHYSLGNDTKVAESYAKYMALKKGNISTSDYFQLGVYYYTAASKNKFHARSGNRTGTCQTIL